MSLVDKDRDVNFDTLSISELWNRVENKITTSFLIGDNPVKPSNGIFTGLQLQEIIETFRDSVLKFAEEDKRAFIAAGINLNTDETIDEDGETKNWLITNFYHIPAITVLITLTNIEYEIKNAETQVLTDLLNNASKDSKDNLASKVADLGYRLESEKKKREIEILQKDKEFSQIKIDSKNAEIADRDKAIAWFIVIVLAFTVMIFFVIRSNMLRRKANKQLLEQKEIIEVKQKEILDSIHYAKRIQNSLLPNEKQIGKAIDRLQK